MVMTMHVPCSGLTYVLSMVSTDKGRKKIWKVDNIYDSDYLVSEHLSFTYK